MKAFKSDRGFVQVVHSNYPHESCENRIISEGSAIGDYEDSVENPGSSFLWVGDNHRLNREEVADLIRRMQHWLDHKRLPMDEGDSDGT